LFLANGQPQVSHYTDSKTTGLEPTGEVWDETVLFFFRPKCALMALSFDDVDGFALFFGR
jgi:hypothetical protein